MATPMLGQFLVAINGFVSVRNQDQLASYLALEPPFNGHYLRVIEELRATYPKGGEDALEQKCSQSLAAAREGADGSPWTPFVKFMVQYLGYLRDVDTDPRMYLATYKLLSELQQRGNSALHHPILGYLILPVVVTNARLVCRLAIGLDKKPELVAQARAAEGQQQSGGEDAGPRETLPERAANILRNAFVTCLNDRTSGLDNDGRPEGKKKGIYIIANLCLKILFQCKKTRNATQIFENIYNLSPPLSAYPKRDRIPYLYYLGRYLFQNSHFYRAQLVLQAAYDESPTRPDCTRQRRQILIYLIASNVTLGRFPTAALLSRPEAEGLTARFQPLCRAIQRGDLASFRTHLALDGPHAPWFLHFRILLQLRNRAEVLLWRSLVRRTWILQGSRPQPGTKIAPTVNIHDLVAGFAFLEDRASAAARNGGGGDGAGNGDYADPDFDSVEYEDRDHAGRATDGVPDPASLAVESILSSLIDQGLLGGYISHSRLKFAITGTKSKGSVLAAGFPEPWEVVRARAEREGEGDEVPGWKKKAGFGGGMVINLSGARAAGSAGGL